ncbi:MAG: glycosyltransferase family 4 protein [Patescibacteria group bacterium]
MNVLMLSRDSALFREESAFRLRAREYARLFSRLVIVAEGREKFEEGTLVGVPAWSRGAIGFYFTGARILRKKLPEDSWVITAQEEITGLAALFLSWRFNIPWQYQVHTDILNPYLRKESWKQAIRVRIAQMLLKRASRIRVVSERIKRTIHTRRPVDILPITVELGSYYEVGAHRSYEDPVGEFVFLVASRLSQEKNILMIIRAFERILKDYPRTLLRIVGDGPERAMLEDYVRIQKLGTHVQFEGWIDDPVRFFASDHCFVSASWYEGYGLSLVQAMASGMPIVTTDVGVVGELLKDNISGLVVEVGDEGNFLRELLRVRKDFSIRWGIGTEAYKKAQTLSTQEEYLLMFKDLLVRCTRNV